MVFHRVSLVRLERTQGRLGKQERQQHSVQRVPPKRTRLPVQPRAQHVPRRVQGVRTNRRRVRQRRIVCAHHARHAQILQTVLLR